MDQGQEIQVLLIHGAGMVCKSLSRDCTWGEADACLVCGGVSCLGHQAAGPSVPTTSLAFYLYVEKQSRFCENKYLGRYFCWEKHFYDRNNL